MGEHTVKRVLDLFLPFTVAAGLVLCFWLWPRESEQARNIGSEEEGEQLSLTDY